MLVDYHFSIIDWGWSPTNILYRVSTEGYVDKEGIPGHKILIKDIRPELRPVQLAYNALNPCEQQVINAKYMPYTIDGRKAQDRERARFMGKTTSEFRRIYQGSAKKVKKLIKLLT